MVFSSLLFLFRFLPVMLLLYFVAPTRLRNGILFIGSLVFYGWGEPVYIVLLLFSTVVDFIHGKMVDHYKNKGNIAAAKMAVASSVVINLALLCFFKYADFLIGSVNAVTGSEIALFHLTLPIGISFYTFQTMSYTIDVYRGDAKVQKSIVAFGAYVSMFPQLIAGPIVRYSTIEKELNSRKETVAEFYLGIRYFVIGLGKKILIANRIGAVWSEIMGIAAGDRSVLMAWLGIFAFGMQLYFDFSGYSDMASGLGRMFGFHFPANFRYPYESKSITEFWRRWHITLGTWFREYVYIPLGGSRKGKLCQVRNILIVWLLTGIWHGAGWNFLLWGLYFGVILFVEKIFLQKYLIKLPMALQSVYALLLVFLGWVLFAFDDMGQGMLYLRQMFGMAGDGTIAFLNERTLYLFRTNIVLLVMAGVGATSLPARLCGTYIKDKKAAVCEPAFLLIILLLSTAFLVNAGYNPFLYFRF
ncbi:MAG: MBOAT family O-acyltransferase [Clostridium sp.]